MDNKQRRNMQMKKGRQAICIGLLSALWIILLCTMHIACFDVFEENNKSFYFIAVFAGAVQIIALWIIQRVQFTKWFFVLVICIYLACLFLTVSFLINFYVLHDPGPKGLTICCICMDLMCLCSCIRFLRKKKTRTNEQHAG